MNRGFFPALSALAVIASSSLYYIWKKNSTPEPELTDRPIIKNILIALRKRAFATFREIAFIVSNLRTLEGELEAKKIGEIIMRDGGSGELKLKAIQSLVIEAFHISRQSFEYSCNYYLQNDIEIKMLMELFRKDLNMALEGVIEAYHGPTPRVSMEEALRIEEQIIRRRIKVIERRYTQNLNEKECLLQEFQIQDYLSQQGISHEKQPNEKVFMGILENFYRTDYQFKDRFERLELEMDMFIIELEGRMRGGQEEERSREIKIQE